jgi:hypothetical protein
MYLKQQGGRTFTLMSLQIFHTRVSLNVVSDSFFIQGEPRTCPHPGKAHLKVSFSLPSLLRLFVGSLGPS